MNTLYLHDSGRNQHRRAGSGLLTPLFRQVTRLLFLVGWLGAITQAQAQNGLAFMHGADDNSGGGTGVSMYVSNGDGTFKLTKTFDTGFDRDNKSTEVFGDDGLSATFYVDATGDGVVDIVHATEFDGTTVGNFIFVYPGTGKGGFAKTPIVTSNNPGAGNLYQFAGIDCCQQSFMADVNGDGKVDYVFSGNDNKITVYPGNGDGTFNMTGVQTSLSGASGYYTSGVTPDEVGFLTDVNKDGKADLVMTHQYPSTTEVWLATSGGSFSSSPVVTTGFAQTGSSIFTGKGGNETSQLIDVTGDGNVDFVHANEFDGKNTVFVFAGNGAGGFATTFTSSVLTNPAGTNQQVIGEWGGEYAQWVDVTGDGKPDFVTSADWLGANSGIYVWVNNTASAGTTASFGATPKVSLVGCGNFQTGADLTETTGIVKVFATGTTFATNGRPIQTTGTIAPGGVAADLAIWLRADDLTNLADGAKVGTWSDAVTGGQAVTQGIDFYRPTFNKTTASRLVNYNPSLSFNGDIANWLQSDHRIYCNNSPFQLISLALDERAFKTEYRGSMGVGPDGNYPALDLYTDAYSPNGWRPFMGNSIPNPWTGGGALLFNGNTGGTNRQPQIFSLGSANAVVTANYGADNIVSHVDGYKEATTLDAFQANVFIGNQLFIGSSGGEFWKGRIPEALVYTRQLTDAEMVRVNSYLAAKYGITQDQRTATDYVASDGTTKFWNATTNGIYKANIGVIGRDDASGLNQKQSKSVNIQAQPIISLATIAASNSANAGIFLTDKSFASWADNGNPHSYSIAYAPLTFTPPGGAQFYRMAATWKMQTTGGVGTSFYVGIPASSFADHLLINTLSSAFTPATTTEVALVPDGKGNLVTATPVVIANGAFFTFGASQKVPGGVAANLKLWFKADAGVTTSGTAITQWDNAVSAVPYSLTQTVAAAQPQYATSGERLVNYNSSVYFQGSNALYNSTSFMSGSSPYTFMMMAQDESAGVGVGTAFSAANVFDYFEFNKLNYGAISNGWNPYGVGGSPDLGPFGKGTKYAPSGGVNGFYNGTDFTRDTKTANVQPQVLGFASANSVASFGTSMTTWTDGYKDTPNWSFINESAGLATAAQTYFFKELSIGADRGAYTTEPWQGPINEFVVYERALTDQEAQRVNTYIAIKYGVTLGQGNGAIGNNANNVDYLATDGSTVWSNTANVGYAYHIAGIGQDNVEGLNQKQSRSVNAGFQPAIGLGTVAETNDANPNSFTANLSYMTWGSNSKSTDYATVYTPNSFTATAPVYLMSRVWKVQETNANPVGTVTVSIPGSGTGTYLLVASSATSLTNGGATEIAMLPDGAGNLVASRDLTDGQYFTFAKSILAPGCVTPSLALWVKADDGGAVVGQQTAAWPDYSPNGAAVPSSGTMVVQTPDAAHNFQPYFTGFSASNYFFDANSPVSPNKDNTAGGAYVGTQTQSDLAIFAVVRPTSAGSGRITGNDNEGPAFPFAAEPGVSLYLGASHFYKFSNGTVGPNYSVAAPVGQNVVLGWNATNATSSSLVMSQNGADQLFTGQGTFGFNGTRLAIGYGTFDVAGGFPGDIQEVIWYRTSISPINRQKIQSYLGLKYGVTLNHNYLSGAGTTVYDVSSYSANVTGLGRDDCQLLIQKQSKSGNSGAKLTIGLAGTIAASNATNPGSFSTDASFLVMGENGLTGITPFSAASGTACAPLSPITHVTKTAYKATETGNVGPVFVQFDAAGYGFNPGFPLYMQVYSDAGFTTLLAATPMSFSGGIATSSYNFPANSTSYVRFAGNTSFLANACTAPKPQTYHFNRWYYGDKAKTIVSNYGFGNTGVEPVMSVSVTDGTTDPNVLLYKPTVNWWPVFDGLGLFIPRYDDNSASQQGSVVTTRMQFYAPSPSSFSTASTSLVAANTVDFVLRDIDGYIGGRDVVKVYGKIGAATVFPKITKNNLYPSLAGTALTISGNTVTGGPLPWDLTVLGDAYVSFDSPVEQVFVEYTKQNTYGFKVYNDLRIGSVNITCKAPTPRAPLADNVYLYKQATPSVQKTGEPVVFKFTIQNADCNNKVIDFNDNLPGGLTWVDSTVTTSLNFASANTYGNAQQLSISGMTVPPGTSYLYATAKGRTQGTYQNQANYTVQGGTGATLLSDDPSEVGTTFQPTPVTLIANDPEAALVVAKKVDKTTSPQNSTLTYTYTITNPNAGSAVLTTFNDVLPGELTYIGGTLTGIGSATVNAYAGISVLTIRNLNVTAGSTLTLTVQANVNSYTNNAVATNVAQVTPDVLSGFRIVNYNTGPASTTVTTLPPSVTINSPLANASLSTSSPTIAGTATPGSSVTVAGGPGSSGGPKVLVADPTTGAWSTSALSFPSGANSVSATAGNAGGNSPTAAVNFSIAAPLTVNSSPAALSTVTNTPKSGSAAQAITPGGGNLPLTYSAFNPASTSLVSANTTTTPHGSASIDPVTGVYSYTPSPGYSGTDAIGIKVCDSSTPIQQCAASIIPIFIAAPASASATLDCSTAQISGIVAGTPGNGILKLTMSVSTTGAFPVTVSGSGLSANPSPYTYNTSAMGMQTFYVPLSYSGAAFAAGTTFTVAGAGVCTVDMTAVTPKTVSTSVLNLGPACSPASAATLVK